MKSHNIRIIEHDNGSFEIGFIVTLGKPDKNGTRTWRKGNRRNMFRLLKRNKLLNAGA